ncbi:MAG: hypothetical protein HYV26_22770 [Candidatus Hydrogenedentes bacterium]|nr:hypothetical protein [Candidatus Hydrogenedentota bacterium]
MENTEEPKESYDFTRVPPPLRRAPAEPAVLPGPLWARMDYLLHHPDSVVESIKRGQDLGLLTRTFVLAAAVASAVYGVVMGGTNFFQGSETAVTTELLYMVTASIKVPALFLVTLLIVLPPMYVSGIFSGVRLSFTQVSTLLLSSTALATITLASMAMVALFFALTTRTYDFMKLMHVLFFAYAGLAGLIFLVRAFRYVSPRLTEGPMLIFIIWFFLYAFVGTQLAWVLRPFIGNPDLPFMLFREQEGNFYENLMRTLENVLD